ncbi:MAG: hypothetical protein Q4E89_11010 [Eubacteriales bacterium]|nr:hypothetical protein [Eubacteriales bacterium]
MEKVCDTAEDDLPCCKEKETKVTNLSQKSHEDVSLKFYGTQTMLYASSRIRKENIINALRDDMT